MIYTLVLFAGTWSLALSGGGGASSYGSAGSYAGASSSASSGGRGGGVGYTGGEPGYKGGGGGAAYTGSETSYAGGGTGFIGGGGGGGGLGFFPSGLNFGPGCHCAPNFGAGLDPIMMQKVIQDQIRQLQDFSTTMSKGGAGSTTSFYEGYGGYGKGSYGSGTGSYGSGGYGGHQLNPGYGKGFIGYGSANADSYAGGSNTGYTGGGTGLDLRFGSEIPQAAAPGGKYFGISSSSKSSSSNINGKTQISKEASVTVNDNGKVTTYRS